MLSKIVTATKQLCGMLFGDVCVKKKIKYFKNLLIYTKKEKFWEDMPKTTMVVTCGLVAVNAGRGGKVFFHRMAFCILDTELYQ